MRKFASLIVVLCILFLCYFQFGRDPYVNQVFTDSNPNGYGMTLSVTANQILILNKENLAKRLVRQVLDNTFDNVLFSYDVLGYPNSITLTVYANELARTWDIPSFTVRYTPNSFEFIP